MAIRAALFVRGLGTTVVSQAIWMFKPTKGPAQSRNMLKYLAPTFRVEIMMTAPTKQMRMAPMMWKQCSRRRPLDHDRKRVKKYANR